MEIFSGSQEPRKVDLVGFMLAVNDKLFILRSGKELEFNLIKISTAAILTQPESTPMRK